ncbi:MAG: site-2 protease family protein [Candidatus Saccharimonadales bacterium]
MQFSFDAFTLIVTLVSLIIAITLHEMMHAYVGYRLGDTTAHEAGRISLNPLRHVDPFATIVLPIITLLIFHAPILAAKPVPFNPSRVKYEEFGAAMIAAAGPLTNLLLAAIGGVLARLFVGNPDVFNVLTIFVSLNVGLFVFNLIPIPPLDGSRVLYAFAPDGLRGLMEQLEQYGIFIVFALVLFVPAFTGILINLNRAISLFLL